ncbi:hypothetical protein Pcinc_027583 [Petrolisthes cinctipes]|uniref:Neurotransmitter-gated ion-channel ligand-binding domain-containing protein n=1 Tax=Petrolisthes cinctipes TaxID=88211 RepID=A0AAE1K8L7_PETCI|nr:hypothetical protein Pcinc_027583 [Petrolisthes cinctipes]
MPVGAMWGVAGGGHLCLLALLSLLSCLHQAHAKEFFMESTDKEILDFLLHNSRYDMRVRPPLEEGPLRVNVSVLLLSLYSPDESSLNYEVELLLHQHWFDPRLTFNDNGRHAYLSGMHHLHQIWLPDTYFVFRGQFKEELSNDNIALKIFRGGKVSYTIRRYLILSCTGDLQKFPFDDPFCTFSMESISYEERDLKYFWVNNTNSDNGKSLERSGRLVSLNAYMIENSTHVCNDTFFWRGGLGSVRFS